MVLYVMSAPRSLDQNNTRGCSLMPVGNTPATVSDALPLAGERICVMFGLYIMLFITDEKATGNLSQRLCKRTYLGHFSISLVA
jgi:hypothetical protein